MNNLHPSSGYGLCMPLSHQAHIKMYTFDRYFSLKCACIIYIYTHIFVHATNRCHSRPAAMILVIQYSIVRVCCWSSPQGRTSGGFPLASADSLALLLSTHPRVLLFLCVLRGVLTSRTVGLKDTFWIVVSAAPFSKPPEQCPLPLATWGCTYVSLSFPVTSAFRPDGSGFLFWNQRTFLGCVSPGTLHLLFLKLFFSSVFSQLYR